ncbi:nuclear transport factor 2 family protein [Agrobacterium tumefaciens]|uniref:nuclear transport factor 2 family protein n=1 Tax=Agrobacterium tumefaciens TaxID=358 RepID=UPI00220C9DFF|nr:nuclear transport factor 2 family protein [Agrobacterium tumefaciens]UXT00355.1 nuclear transport factor 2 family protein [Agrobacterium tumefaciens]
MNAGELAKAVFAAVDALRPEAFAEFLTEDGTFTFGNWPSAHGRAAAAKIVSDFFAGINGISHDISGVWEEDETVIVRLAVTYELKNGSSITLPCANIWKIEGDKIQDYCIYMDVNPVFA